MFRCVISKTLASRIVDGIKESIEDRVLMDLDIDEEDDPDDDGTWDEISVIVNDFIIPGLDESVREYFENRPAQLKKFSNMLRGIK